MDILDPARVVEDPLSQCGLPRVYVGRDANVAHFGQLPSGGRSWGRCPATRKGRGVRVWALLV